MATMAVPGYGVGYDRHWQQLDYYNRTATNGDNPTADQCVAMGRTDEDVAKISAGRTFCRDETAAHGPVTISFVRVVDTSQLDADPARVTIEVWFSYRP